MPLVKMRWVRFFGGLVGFGWCVCLGCWTEGGAKLYDESAFFLWVGGFLVGGGFWLVQRLLGIPSSRQCDDHTIKGMRRQMGCVPSAHL